MDEPGRAVAPRQLAARQAAAIPLASPAPALGRGDLYAVLLLMLLAAGMRLWQLGHTEVLARDSFSYIRIAWDLEHQDWRQVVRTSPQHPGYPATVLAVSQVVRQYRNDDPAQMMQLSAQVASSLASVLLMIPLFLIGRELFDRRVSFWGALLFQALPAMGQLMADGLSEPLFLLCSATSLWLGMRSLRTGSATGFVGAGLAGGLAYLTRPEGGVIVLAIGLVLLAMQAVGRWRRGWGHWLDCSIGLTAGTLVVAAPFMVLIGHVTTKTTPQTIINARTDQVFLKRESETALAFTGKMPPPGVWAVWDPVHPWGRAEHAFKDRLGWGLQAVVLILSRSFFWVAWVPMLGGLWWFRDRLRVTPVSWVLILAAGFITVLGYLVACTMGYLSERHLVLVVLAGCFWAAAGMELTGRWLAAKLVRVPAEKQGFWQRGRTWSLVLLCALTLPAMAKSMGRLHGERTGLREAGEWLARNALPGDRVVDPYGWTFYYSGRVFTEKMTGLQRHEPPVQYVVLEEADRSKHTRLADEITKANELARTGRKIQSWDVPHGAVAVYEVPWDGR
jgi:4-amino-4-deoxy-L-arabinose transferase-like glycosyltransferase